MCAEAEYLQEDRHKDSCRNVLFNSRAVYGSEKLLTGENVMGTNLKGCAAENSFSCYCRWDASVQ